MWEFGPGRCREKHSIESSSARLLASQEPRGDPAGPFTSLTRLLPRTSAHWTIWRSTCCGVYDQVSPYLRFKNNTKNKHATDETTRAGKAARKNNKSVMRADRLVPAHCMRKEVFIRFEDLVQGCGDRAPATHCPCSITVLPQSGLPPQYLGLRELGHSVVP